MHQMIYCNGVWSPWRKTGGNLGLWRADGALEVFEARLEIPFHMEDHILRLQRSCIGYDEINMELLPSSEEIYKNTMELLQKSDFPEGIVHILATPGNSNDLKKSLGFPELIIDVRRLERVDMPPLKMKTEDAKRYFPECKLTAGYGYARRFQAKAAALGFDSFLYHDERGGILEGPYENFFVVTKTSCLYTPANDVLKGVTRKIFLELAKESKIFREVREVPWPIHIGYLEQCDEAFLSSTTKGGIVPSGEMGDAAQIRQIDGYDHFITGPDTKSARLKKLFLEYRENYFKSRGT